MGRKPSLIWVQVVGRWESPERLGSLGGASEQGYPVGLECSERRRFWSSRVRGWHPQGEREERDSESARRERSSHSE